MIVTDLDGTFVPNMKDLIPKNMEALSAAKRAGIHVCACTGRHWGFARCILEEGEFDPLCIASNGAAVIESYTGVYRRKRTIPADVLPKITDFLAEKAMGEVIKTKRTFDANGYGGRGGMEFIRTCDKEFFSNYNPNQPERVMEYSVNHMGGAFPMITHSYRDREEWLASTGDDTERIIFDIGRNDVADIEELQAELDAIADVEVTSAYGTVMEIMAKGANKGEALRYLADYYGVPQSQVLAIGDNINDRAMVTWAGVGVAVASGHQALKDVADLIGPPCIEGAVGKIIYDCIEGRI